MHQAMKSASSPSSDSVRDSVREHYAAIQAASEGAACAPSCCGANPDASLELGYAQADLDALPEGANLGLGCGNPQALAALQLGERVLDLGSGGGIDCFLAAKRVGPTGRVIGVDMTPEMLKSARAAKLRMRADNVEFRLGEIEHLPIADGTIDVILSNCVINLSPDKQQVCREAFRVLAPGGRLAIRDVIATAPMPEALANDPRMVAGCVGAAAPVAELKAALLKAGFRSVDIDVDEASRAVIATWFPGSGAERYVASASITAKKAGACGCGPSGCS
jgi:SAM-dependent methyltransferase